MPRELKDYLHKSLYQTLKQRDVAKAETLLEQLKEEDPFSVNTRGLELEYLLLSKRVEEAAQLADQLVKSYPQSSRIFFLAGQVAFHQKRYKESESLFCESHRLYPSDQSRQWMAKTQINDGKLDQAEAALLDLVGGNPRIHADLAWLYERKKDYPRAERELNAFIDRFPDQAWAKAKQKRLRAKAMDAKEVVAELDDLDTYGEEIPEELSEVYLESLLKTGQIKKARSRVEVSLPKLDAKQANAIAWPCYFSQMYDLAFELFYKAFPEQFHNTKFLNSFQKAARHCERIPDLLRLYEQYAPQNHGLYGRSTELRTKYNL